MHPVNTYEGAKDLLTKRFSKGFSKDSDIITGIVLVPLDLKYSKEEIIPSINRWSHASADFTDFFWGGYMPKTEAKNFSDIEPVTTVDNKEWYYSTTLYTAFVEKIKSETKGWEETGGPVLILTNARFDEFKKVAYFDFTTALFIDLHQAREDKLFITVSHFFQDIFNFAKKINKMNSTDPVFNFSDHYAGKLGKRSLKELLLFYMPDAIKQTFRAAFHVAVKDISKTSK